MKILVVGGGGREHAVCRKLHEEGTRVISFMKNQNPGIIRDSDKYFTGDELDHAEIIKVAKGENVDLVFVGPDPVLETPLVDNLLREGIRVASPNRNAARIETSKSFMRDLLSFYGIGGDVSFKAFTDTNEMRSWISDLGREFVVKPVGLTGGKGVKVMGDHFSTVEEGIREAEKILKRDGTVLLEEKLVGEEFSLQCFCDGNNVYPMPLAQDYKRALEGDKGPNTGGMGSITDSDGLLPFVDRSSYEISISTVKRVSDAMKKEGNEYHGIMYAQFMETAEGPKIVEINARFADPEGINVLSVMDSSLTETFLGIADGHVGNQPTFISKATVLKYIVPVGYGSDPRPGPLKIKKGVENSSRRLYYAAVSGTLWNVNMTTSRSLAAVGISDSIIEASVESDLVTEYIDGNFYIRRDIGTAPYMNSKLRRMRELKEAKHPG